MKLELQRLTFFGASSSAGLASAGLSAWVAGAPKVNEAAVEAGLASFDFSAPSDEDPFPNKKPNVGAAGGFLPNVNAGTDDAAVEAGLLSFNPKENGDDAVDAVRGDGAGFVAFFAGFVGVFSSSSIRSWTFF